MYGYNSTISSLIGCSTLTGFVKAAKTPEKRMQLHFNHAEAIMPIHSALGLHKDKEGLRGDMRLEEMMKREWKTYAFAPFLGNIEIQVYEKPQSLDKYLVMYADESPVILPACTDVLCRVDDFEAYYREKGVVGCNFDDVCDNKGMPSVGGWSDVYGKETGPLTMQVGQ
jgi:hypothetical protein